MDILSFPALTNWIVEKMKTENALKQPQVLNNNLVHANFANPWNWIPVSQGKLNKNSIRTIGLRRQDFYEVIVNSIHHHYHFEEFS